MILSKYLLIYSDSLLKAGYQAKTVITDISHTFSGNGILNNDTGIKSGILHFPRNNLILLFLYHMRVTAKNTTEIKNIQNRKILIKI